MVKNSQDSFEDPLEGIDPVMKQAFSMPEEDTPENSELDSVEFPNEDVSEQKSLSSFGNLQGIDLDTQGSDVVAPDISQIEFPDLASSSVEGERIEEGIFSNIPVKVAAELGRASLSLKDVYELCEGSIIELERLVGEPLDLVVNGQVIAQGEVVAIDNKYGLRVKSLVSNSSGY